MFRFGTTRSYTSPTKWFRSHQVQISETVRNLRGQKTTVERWAADKWG